MSQAAIWLPDIPRYYTAIAEWLACLLCIFEAKRKITGWRQGAISIAVLAVQIAFLNLTDQAEGILWMLCMVGAVLLMYGFLYISCDTTAVTVGYYCARAFGIAEFTAALEWETYCYFVVDYQMNSKLFECVWFVLIYGSVNLLLFLLYRRVNNSEKFCLATKEECLVCVILALSVFCLSNIGFVFPNSPFGGRHSGEIFNVRTLVDLGGVAMMYAFHAQKMDQYTRREMENMQNLIYSQYVQYQQTKEVIESLNYRYHDLKHYIVALQAEEDQEKKDFYFKKLEDKIQSIELLTYTGNQVIDVMLTAKGIQCQKKGITLTSVVDGSLFDFIDDMDICAIFGSAMDNAIKCEEQIEEKEKRMIHISVCRKEEFLMIRFENYYEKKQKRESAFQHLEKKGKRLYEYGMKSLQYVVRKYEGEMSTSIEDDWYYLKLLIPIPEGKKEENVTEV